MESLQRALQGEDADAFLDFMRKLLRWIPEERPSTEDLLSDPWVNPWLETEED